MKSTILAAVIITCGYINTNAQTAATTVQPVSRTTTKTYGSSKFGAEISTTFSHSYSKSAKSSSTSLNAELKGRIMGTKPSLARGSAAIDVTGNKGAVRGTLKFAGASILNYDRTFTSSLTWKSTPITKTLRAGRWRWGIGPVSLAINIDASASLWAEATASVATSPTGPSFALTAGPCADAAATGEASIDIIIAGAGVEGSVRLGAHRLLANAQLYSKAAQQWLKYGAVLQSDGTNGRVRAYVRIGIKLLFIRLYKTWWTTLYDGTGTGRSDTLYSSSDIRVL